MTQSDSTTVTGDSKKSYRSNWTLGRFALSGVFVAIAIGLVFQGVVYISDGVGGLVPFLMIVLGPSLGVFYVWYLLFRVPEENTE